MLQDYILALQLASLVCKQTIYIILTQTFNDHVIEVAAKKLFVEAYFGGNVF